LSAVVRTVRSVTGTVNRVGITAGRAVAIIQIAASTIVAVRKATDSQRKTALKAWLIVAMVMMVVVVSISISLGVGLGLECENQQERCGHHSEIFH
jgi:hypothetical protein